MHLPGLLGDARTQLADINHRHCQSKQWNVRAWGAEGWEAHSRVANYNVKRYLKEQRGERYNGQSLSQYDARAISVCNCATGIGESYDGESWLFKRYLR